MRKQVGSKLLYLRGIARKKWIRCLRLEVLQSRRFSILHYQGECGLLSLQTTQGQSFMRLSPYWCWFCDSFFCCLLQTMKVHVLLLVFGFVAVFRAAQADFAGQKSFVFFVACHSLVVWFLTSSVLLFVSLRQSTTSRTGFLKVKDWGTSWTTGRA